MEVKKMKELFELTKDLLLAKNHRETNQIIVEWAKRIFKADRVCLILKNIHQELVIKAGLPVGEHGIGLKLNNETGENLLRQVMENRVPILIDNPQKDPRVSYMRELIRIHHISSITKTGFTKFIITLPLNMARS